MRTQRLISSVVGCLVLMFANAASFGADEKKKGIPEAPTSAETVSGSYYRGDGLGYNVSLTLKENGDYAAEWHGCLGKYGVGSGTWQLTDKRISFAPTKEEGMMEGHLQSLDVMKFKGDWILVPTEKRGREFYDKWGISGFSCFQNGKNIK